MSWNISVVFAYAFWAYILIMQRSVAAYLFMIYTRM